MKFDEILEKIGEFGWYQKCIVLLILLPSAFVAMQNMGYIFTSAIPKYRCFVDGCDNSSTGYYEPFLNFTTPYEFTDDNSVKYSECQLYSSIVNGSGWESRDTCANDTFDRSQSAQCFSWKYDDSEYGSTVVTQWNLVCDDSNQVALSQSIYMLGVMLGPIVIGAIADKYGRKPILLISLFIALLMGVSSAYDPYYPLFLTLRFFLGAACQGSLIVLLVMSVEFVGKKHRAQTGMFMSVIFSIGEVIYGGIAYGIHDWKLLQLIISLPMVVFLVYYWLIPESPRWLLANDNEKGARKVLERIANSNGKTLTNEMLANYQSDEPANENGNHDDGNKKVTWFDLFRTSYMRIITLNLCFNWFMITIAYYGITMSAPTVNGNAYINFIILCSVEVPAYIFGMLAMDKFGRRYPLCLCMIVGGIAGICTGVVPSSSEYSWLTITLATVGKFGAASAFGIIYVFTAELYPTAIRNNGLAVSSFIGHIGGVVAPYIAALKSVNSYLPLVIFGICSLTSGLAGLTLPETLGRHLPETIEDSKQMKMCACFSTKTTLIRSK